MMGMRFSTAWGLDTGRVDWTLAACKEMPDLELMFGNASEQNAAKKTCRECPIRVDCLADAMSGHVEHGVYGGLTDRERRLLRRLHPDVTDWRAFLSVQPQNPPRCGTNAGYQAHLAADDPRCHACLEAHREYKANLAAGVRVGRPQRYRAML